MAQFALNMEEGAAADHAHMLDFLKRALEEFELNSRIPRLVRELANRRPLLFVHVSISLLCTERESPGRRYLAAVLLSTPLCMTCLSDPKAFTRQQAVQAARALLSSDHEFDVRLAREMPGRYGELGRLNGTSAARGLDILDEVSDGRRLVPILLHLVDHPDTSLASKATLTVGRRISNPNWIERRMATEDPRMRANLVECLWGIDCPSSRRILDHNLHDENNRVVGNAVVGLHALGDPSVRSKIGTMATSFKPLFRSSAAWAMGHLGKPEFRDNLKSLVRDDSTVVRKAALRALMNIHQLQHTIEVITAPPQAPQPIEAVGPIPMLPRFTPAPIKAPEPIQAVTPVLLPGDLPDVGSEGVSGAVPNEAELASIGPRLDGSSFSVRDKR